MRRPSGDQRGAPSPFWPAVIWTGSPPSAFTPHPCPTRRAAPQSAAARARLPSRSQAPRIAVPVHATGARLHRLEGLAKLTGRERYVDDLPPGGGGEGWLWGATVRSPAPRGRIRAVRFAPDVPWPEFVVVDHRRIPGPNEVLLIERDQPVLAADYVRHVHEPVVLLAHPSRDAVRRAARAA